METRHIRPIGRSTQGVRLIEIEDQDLVVSLARLSEVSGDQETADPESVEEIVDKKTTG